MPAYVMLGLLGLCLPFLVLLFSFMPVAILAFFLEVGFSGQNSDVTPLAVGLLLVTAAAGLAILATLMASLLRLVRWPRPVGSAVLLLVALVPVVLQAPAVAMWADSELGTALGIEIGPTGLGVGPPGMIGPSGYLHLAVVVLTLLAVELRRRSRGRAQTHTPPAQGSGEGTKRHRPSRSGLVYASAALALTVPVSTLITLEYLRADTERRIQEYADAISGYPYPLAVLDAPGWRAWHLSADAEERRRFKVTYINEDGVQLEVVTRADYDLWHDCPDGQEGTGAGADAGAEGTESEGAESEGTDSHPGAGVGEPVCEEGWTDLSGVNNHASDYGTFLARTVVYDASGESGESAHASAYGKATEARVDLRGSGSQHYTETEDPDATVSTPWAHDADLGPAALLFPANDPRESVLQGEIPFHIPAPDLREAADHVRLLNPADSEAVQELAAATYLAK